MVKPSDPSRYWTNLVDDGTGVLSPPGRRFEPDAPRPRCAGPCMAKSDPRDHDPVFCRGCDGVGMSQPDWHERKAAWDAQIAAERANQPRFWKWLIARFGRRNADVPPGGYPPMPDAFPPPPPPPKWQDPGSHIRDIGSPYPSIPTRPERDPGR